MVKSDILFVGLGGAGCSVIKKAKSRGVNIQNTLLINTNKKFLQQNINYPTLLIGESVLKGFSASGIALGKKAIDESLNDIAAHFLKYNKIAIVAGIAGGTGGSVIYLVERLLNHNFSLGVSLLYPFSMETHRFTLADKIISNAKDIEQDLSYLQTLMPVAYSKEASQLVAMINYIDSINTQMIHEIVNINTKDSE